jgi:trigger factor
LARQAKVDGFRPGKVPLGVIKKMYADRVRAEVSSDLIQSTYVDALQKEGLVPAGHPHIHPIGEQEGFGYTAEFEVYPEISLEGVSELELKQPKATVEQADVDAMIVKLRDQQKKWNSVERDSEENDRVTVNFTGVCEEENFTNGKVENSLIEIGAKKMIPGFEDQLLGLSVGSNKSFELTFPDDYTSEKLAGKAAQFDVEVVKIEESSLPEINEEFVKDYGIEDGSVDAFYVDIKSNMERELDQGLKGMLKNNVMEALYEKIQFTVPKALIDQEIQVLMKPYVENAKQQNLKIEDLNLPQNLFEDQAKRRVALGLILGEIIQTNKMEADDASVRSLVEGMARSYETPDEYVEWYYSDESRLNEVKKVALEEQTVNWIVDQAKVTDEDVSFNDVMEKRSQ